MATDAEEGAPLLVAGSRLGLEQCFGPLRSSPKKMAPFRGRGLINMQVRAEGLLLASQAWALKILRDLLPVESRVIQESNALGLEPHLDVKGYVLCLGGVLVSRDEEASLVVLGCHHMEDLYVERQKVVAARKRPEEPVPAQVVGKKTLLGSGWAKRTYRRRGKCKLNWSSVGLRGRLRGNDSFSSSSLKWVGGLSRQRSCGTRLRRALREAKAFAKRLYGQEELLWSEVLQSHEKVTELTAKLKASKVEVEWLRATNVQEVEGTDDSDGQIARLVPDSTRAMILAEYINGVSFRQRMEFEYSLYAHDGFA
ncbi:hypothetical protein ACLOJK_004023 [Asimina triloba]